MRTYWVPPIPILFSLGPLLCAGPSDDYSHPGNLTGAAQELWPRMFWEGVYWNVLCENTPGRNGVER